MALLKNTVTFFLALLLVNPACCCALNGCGAEEAPARSCCSGPSEDEKDDGDQHQCMCSMNDRFAETKKIDFSSPDLTALPRPSVIVIENIFAPERVVVFSDLKGHSPSPPMRVMYSVFRL